MGIFRGFLTAARESGFVELRTSADGMVRWLRKIDSRAGQQVDQRICIDALTNSATVFSRIAHGKVDSKTFRGISSLQEWITANSCNDKS